MLRVQRVDNSTVGETKIQRPSSDPIKTRTTNMYREDVKSLQNPKEYTTAQVIHKSKISHPVVYIQRKVSAPLATEYDTHETKGFLHTFT